MSRILQLRIDQLRINGGTQLRAQMQSEVVSEYAEAIQRGDTFPPVIAFWDGSAYWLVDGFHRLAAHQDAGIGSIQVDVRDGTLREAILFAVGANSEPRALKRTNADKRRAIEALLRDAEWCQWSDREIAKRCLVSDKTVAVVREEIEGEEGAPAEFRRKSKQARKHKRKGKMVMQEVRKSEEADETRRAIDNLGRLLENAFQIAQELRIRRTERAIERAQEALSADTARLLGE